MNTHTQKNKTKQKQDCFRSLILGLNAYIWYAKRNTNVKVGNCNSEFLCDQPVFKCSHDVSFAIFDELQYFTDLRNCHISTDSIKYIYYNKSSKFVILGVCGTVGNGLASHKRFFISVGKAPVLWSNPLGDCPPLKSRAYFQDNRGLQIFSLYFEGLLDTQQARVTLSYASCNSHASFVFSNHLRHP